MWGKKSHYKKREKRQTENMAYYRYAYELVQRQGVCMDATVMTSCSLDAEFDLCCGPWPTSH